MTRCIVVDSIGNRNNLLCVPSPEVRVRSTHGGDGTGEADSVIQEKSRTSEDTVVPDQKENLNHTAKDSEMDTSTKIVGAVPGFSSHHTSKPLQNINNFQPANEYNQTPQTPTKMELDNISKTNGIQLPNVSVSGLSSMSKSSNLAIFATPLDLEAEMEAN
jgi:hypothetical protein